MVAKNDIWGVISKNEELDGLLSSSRLQKKIGQNQRGSQDSAVANSLRKL
jgi:hypothetical protein